MTTPLHLFEGHGIELEYMLVDRDTLAVAPICDRILAAAAGEPCSELETGPIAWSKELALHVIELKTNGPVGSITDDLVAAFEADLRRIDALAAGLGARLMPTAMHPTMNPATDTRLWPHDDREIYAAYDRAFGCSGHGWGNLQSCHLNLPFCGGDEFGRLHGAVRAVLPLLPALAASSPLVEAQVTGSLNARLAVYATNQRRVPSIIGSIVPEAVFTPEAYAAEILAPMYRDIAPLDPGGVLQHEWLNSRGAIARFDRDAIEIRVLDVQETPAADLGIARLVTAVVRALVEERWVPRAEVEALDTADLRRLFDRTVVAADEATLEDGPILRALGFAGERASAGEVWTWLYESLVRDTLLPSSRLRTALETMLTKGPLARRILRAVGDLPTLGDIAEVYRELADCLTGGRSFD